MQGWISTAIAIGGIIISFFINIGQMWISDSLQEHRLKSIEQVVNVRAIIAYERRMTSLEARAATTEFNLNKLTKHVETHEHKD